MFRIFVFYENKKLLIFLTKIRIREYLKSKKPLIRRIVMMYVYILHCCMYNTTDLN